MHAPRKREGKPLRSTPNFERGKTGIGRNNRVLILWEPVVSLVLLVFQFSRTEACRVVGGKKCGRGRGGAWRARGGGGIRRGKENG